MGRKKGDIRRPYDGFQVKLKPTAFAKLSALQEALSAQAGRPLAKTTVIEMAMDLIGRIGLEGKGWQPATDGERDERGNLISTGA